MKATIRLPFLCLTVGASLLLSACALPSTGIIPTGGDTYMVTAQIYFGNGYAATSKAQAEAGEYCRNSGKQLKIIDSKPVDGLPGISQSKGTVSFRCV